MKLDGYTIKNFIGALSEPDRILGEVQRWEKAAKRRCLEVNSQWYSYYRDDSGFDVFQEDWDNLLIIDAARPDILREIAPSDWSIDIRRSPGTYSFEFMENSFLPGPHHDTVYITANPHAAKLPNDLFHATYNLLNSKWNDEKRTVLPEEVVDSTLSLASVYPNKRLLVHLMQPHFPFIGELGRQLEHGGVEMHLSDNEQSEEPHPWDRRMFNRDIEHETLLKAFKENHEIALEHAEDIVDALDGKSIITADHANLLGERGFPIPIRMYGHPQNMHKRELIEVPWIEIPGDRRDISADPPRSRNPLDDEIAKDRLQKLGYMR